MLTLTAALVLTGGLWLRAQQSDEGSTGTVTGLRRARLPWSSSAGIRVLHNTIRRVREAPPDMEAGTRSHGRSGCKFAHHREEGISDAEALLTGNQLGAEGTRTGNEAPNR
jgi:hypothetical protein